MNIFICPVTNEKLKLAVIDGVRFWYSTYSGGRLLNLTIAKSLIGEEAIQELLRKVAKDKTQISWKKCPSCRRKMSFILEPTWIGKWEVDICKTCQLLWLDKDEHPEVPSSEELLKSDEDPAIKSQQLILKAKAQLDKEFIKTKKNSIISTDAQPSEVLFNLFGLPTEKADDEFHYKRKFITTVLCFGVIFFHKFYLSINPGWIMEYGLYPENLMLNNGKNVLTHIFLHYGWSDLLTNLYFFFIFSDDLEEDLGSFVYVLYILISAIIISLIMNFMPTDIGLPHVGLSGVIMSILVYYTLRFDKAKIGYAIPFLFFGSESYRSEKGGFFQFRLPAYTVLFYFMLKDIILFYYFELYEESYVSYWMYVSGALTGLILYFVIQSFRVYKNSTSLDEL